MKQSYFTSCWNVIIGCSRKHLWVNECSSRAVVCGGLPAGALGCAAAPLCCPARLWEHQGGSDTSPQGALITTFCSHWVGRDLALKAGAGHGAALYLLTQDIPTLLCLVLDCSIHLSGQKQTRWAKSQRDIRNTLFPHQRLNFLSQKELFVFCCLA